MPLEKIGEIEPSEKVWRYDPSKPCFHREHNPPMHISLGPGIWRHTCPGCGHATIIHIYPRHTTFHV
jgi:hypothetical protein